MRRAPPTSRTVLVAAPGADLSPEPDQLADEERAVDGVVGAGVDPPDVVARHPEHEVGLVDELVGQRAAEVAVDVEPVLVHR